jgi:nucleoside-diphosphate kinase
VDNERQDRSENKGEIMAKKTVGKKQEVKEQKEPLFQRTLVLLKPDAVQRSISGRVIQRFEDAGFKIIGMKMRWVNAEFGKRHYFDVLERHGPAVLNGLIKNITEGPVIAMVLEGVAAIEIVRKMVGSTEPKSALPGTIRGDFAQHSYMLADTKGIGIKNIVHASASPKDAAYEIKLWFTDDELHTYKTVHEVHVF